MKRFLKQVPVPIFGEIADLANFQGKKAIVGGRLTFVPNPGEELEQLVPLPQRDAGKGFFSNLRKSAPKLRLYARQEVLEKTKVRFAFLIDAYLAYGLSTQKKDELVALIGGVPNPDDRFPVDILVFDKRGLIRAQEVTLPATTSHSFNIDTNDIVNSLKQEHKDVRVVVCAPLAPWSIAGVGYEADIPLNRLNFKPLTAAKAAQDRYAFPVATALAGVAVFGALTAQGWGELSQVQTRFEVARRDPSVKKQGGVDNNYFTVMTQRRQFMEAPRRQDLLSNKTLDIIKGIGAIPQVQIIEIKMPAPSLAVRSLQVGIVPVETNQNSISPDRAPDVWMKISVPKSQGAALYQSRDVIRALVSSTGMSIRTASQGWTEENGRRIFTLEGFIHA